MKKRRFTLAALLFVISIISYAQVPGTLSYQGILMQSDGITPIADATHSIAFNFYTVSSGGSALFTRTVSVTTVKGLYTCIIGGGVAPNAPFSTTEMNQLGSQQVYIGIALDAGAELTPRAQLTTTPYALKAQTAASVTQTANPTGGNVAFWGANNTLGIDGSNGLYWDNTNKRLGIGTITPTSPLYVLGGASITGNVFAGGGFTGTTVSTSGLVNAGLNVQVSGTGSPLAPDAGYQSESILFLQRPGVVGKNANTAEVKLSTFENGITGRTTLQFWLSGLPNNENGFGGNAEVPVLTLNGDDGGGTDNRGTVGIGTTSPTATLHVNGSALKTSGGTSWSVPSDARLKADIRDFKDGLSVLMQINPKSFRYNGLAEIAKSVKDEFGIIAQELQPVAPYMITTYSARLHPEDKEKTELLKYDGGTALLYVLVNSVKEQQAEIDTLKKELAEMKKLLEQVKAAQTHISTGR